MTRQAYRKGNGTYALPALTADAVVYLSTGGSDSNDGLSAGRAKLTLAAAYAALPSTGGTIQALAGTFTSSSKFSITPGKPLHLRGLGYGLTVFSYSGTDAAVQVSDGRRVTDAVLNSTTTITSATAAFVAGDVGKRVYGIGIPANTTIASVTNGTSAVLSAAATVTGSGVTITIATFFQDWGTIRDCAIQCTAASPATGLVLWGVHRGVIERTRILGNSYQAGSRGVWAINAYQNYIDASLIENFDTGIDVDGAGHDFGIDDTSIGAQTCCVRVLNTHNVRLRGGQHSGTGATVGLKAIITDSQEAGKGLEVLDVHYEGNGLDVAIGRVADGSTIAVQKPVVVCPLPSGATFDRCYKATINSYVGDGTARTLTLTANCSDPLLIGVGLAGSATISDSSTRPTTISDVNGYIVAPNIIPLAVHTAGRYYVAPQWGSPTTGALTLNSEYATPFFVPKTKSFDRIVIEVSTLGASSTPRLGIRADDGTGMPGATVELDAGTVDASTTGSKSITINQSLSAGVHWPTCACEGAACSTQIITGVNPMVGPTGGGLGLNTNGHACAVVQTGVSGALPSSFTPASVGTAARIALRAA